MKNMKIGFSFVKGILRTKSIMQFNLFKFNFLHLFSKHTYIHTYIHTYTHARTHARTHTYIRFIRIPFTWLFCPNYNKNTNITIK